MRSRKRSGRAADKARGNERRRAPLIVALAGPTASGKSTLAGCLAERLGRSKTAVISLDQYYKNWSHLHKKKRDSINFDHPGSFDFPLFKAHLQALKKGRSIHAPRYSYKSHLRTKRGTIVAPKQWIIVEGLLLFYKKQLRELFDLKVYIDVLDLIAFSRRVRRDLLCRGENVFTVCNKYFGFVLPMQKKYIEPQKKHADIVINGCLTIDHCAKKVLDRIISAPEITRRHCEER
ncbi:MAG: uridine kinase [Candidatus Omnitrophota bacterium]